MKVVIIFCVSSFYDDLKKIYRTAGVGAYSEFDVKGYTQKHIKDGQVPNWFASNKDYYDSIASFSLLTDGKGSEFLNKTTIFTYDIDCCKSMNA